MNLDGTMYFRELDLGAQNCFGLIQPDSCRVTVPCSFLEAAATVVTVHGVTAPGNAMQPTITKCDLAISHCRVGCGIPHSRDPSVSDSPASGAAHIIGPTLN